MIRPGRAAQGPTPLRRDRLPEDHLAATIDRPPGDVMLQIKGEWRSQADMRGLLWIDRLIHD